MKSRYFGKSQINIRVEQGYELERPSSLLLKAEEKGGKIDVYVAEKVAMITKGELL